MREEFLHHIWRLKRFDHTDLKGVHGERIQILNYGQLNHNAGPDFLNAKILIDQTCWVGHVEIHIKSSEWYNHNHQNDPNYKNVILHVVHSHNREVINNTGIPLITLELKHRIDTKLLEHYFLLRQNKTFVACQELIHKIDQSRLRIYLERLLTNRLERKSQYIKQLLSSYNNDWEHVCYLLTAKYLGSNINSEAFLEFSQRLPYALINKNYSNLFRLEALTFGQAGLLKITKDDYFKRLNSEYHHLKNKYCLIPMTGLQWNFGRLRPGNFPSIRLAQLAAIYHKSPKLFRMIIDNPQLEVFQSLLNQSASNYWSEHYIPGKKSKFLIKKIGAKTRNQIIINAFIPLIFTYASIHMNNLLIEKCLNMFANLASENNAILSKWKRFGINSKTAGESQALIELKTQFCEQQKCLNCQIGTKLLFE